MNCASCEHFCMFTKPTGMRTEPQGWGVCQILGSSDGKPDNTMQKAIAIDFEEYHAHLVVSPEFGCVCHQVRSEGIHVS